MSSSPSFIDFDKTKTSSTISSRFASFNPLAPNYDKVWPNQIKQRVKALKKLQFDKIKIDSQLTRDVLELELNYAVKYAPLFNKRQDIISGEYEPNKDDCDFNLDEDQSLANDLTEKLSIDDRGLKPIKGIPGFWLKAMKNDDDFKNMIETCDEPILMHLIDIKGFRVEPLKLILEFHFSQNDYFDNTILLKEYDFRCEPDSNDPWNLQALTVVNSIGCDINWKEGKEVTGLFRFSLFRSGKAIKKTFFNFFNTDAIQKLLKSGDTVETTKELLAEDWKLGKLFYSSLVPNAILYFTGDIFEDYSDSSYTSSSSYTDESTSTDENSSSDESVELIRKRPIKT